jgi:hypothetical protein
MDIEKVKRYSLAELALLIIFVIGLLLAWMVVRSRSRILLTEPIGLRGSGLSVRLPGGTGWEYTPAWTYENDNSMVLAAQRRLSPQTAVKMTWRFEFCSKPVELEDVLAERLAASNAAVQRLEMPAGTGMQAARVTASEGAYNAVFLIARKNLDFGRALELQVLPNHPGIDPFYLEDLLRETASSVIYEAPAELEAGMELLNRFFSRLEADQVAEESFLLTDSRGRTIGFYYRDHQASAANHVVLRSRHYDAQQFRVDSTLEIGRLGDPFHWETRMRLPAAAVQSYSIRRGEDGGLAVSAVGGKARQIACIEQHLLPEMLLTDFVRLFIAQERNEVVVDVLSGTGMVVPVQIGHINTEEAAARSQEVATAVRVTYLHGRDFFDELYYNKDRELVGRFERQPRRRDRLWDRRRPEELGDLFGDQLNIQ